MPVKYKRFHTHLNPTKGDEEPLFLVVQGKVCSECKTKTKLVIRREFALPEVMFKQLYRIAQTVGFQKQQLNQTDQEYLSSLIGTISTVKEEDWNSISVETQDWYNEALIIRNSMKPFPTPLSVFCPGYVGREEAEKVVKAAPSETPKGLTAQQVFSGQAVPKPGSIPGTERKSAGKRGKKPTTGVTDFTRRIIISHPDWTVRQVWEYLRLNGFPGAKVDSVAVARGDIRRIMEIMEEVGWQPPQGEKIDDEEKDKVEVSQV